MPRRHATAVEYACAATWRIGRRAQGVNGRGPEGSQGQRVPRGADARRACASWSPPGTTSWWRPPRASGPRSPTRTSSRPAHRSPPMPTRCSRAADMIVKVKEPQPQEFERFREGQVLFTYLHLAADEGLTRFLAERKVQSVAYETVQTPDGRLPLLAPDVGDRRPDGATGGSRRAGTSARRPRCPHGRGLRRGARARSWSSARAWRAPTPPRSPRAWRPRSPSSTATSNACATSIACGTAGSRR